MAKTLAGEKFDYFFSITNLTVVAHDVLQLARKGVVNFHDGPLPQYAGLYVTSWALINQEKQHGITWHTMTAGVDEGEILKQRIFPLSADETAFSLNTRCYEAGAETFAELVGELATDTATHIAQDFTDRSYFAKHKRPSAAGTFSWNQPGSAISALARGLEFGPYLNPLCLPKFVVGEAVYIAREITVAARRTRSPAGTVLRLDHSLHVAAQDCDVVIGEIWTGAGQKIAASDLAEMHGLEVGHTLAELGPNTAESLTTLYENICRGDSFWQKQWSDTRLPDIPYARHGNSRDSAGQYETRSLLIEASALSDLDVPESRIADWLTAAFAGYLARLCGNEHFTIGYAHADLRREIRGHEAFFATYVPLQVMLKAHVSGKDGLAGLVAHLESVRSHRTFSHDLLLRVPELRATDLPRMNITVEQVKSTTDFEVLPESELAVLIADSGEMNWVFDPAVYDGADIARMQSQFEVFLAGLASSDDRALAQNSHLVGKRKATNPGRLEQDRDAFFVTMHACTS